MKKYILFFDVDHTLFDHRIRSVPDSTIDALRRVRNREDTILALATGRARYMLDVVEEILPFFEVLITVNGQLVYLGDEILHDQPMPTPDVLRAKATLESNRLLYGMLGKRKHSIRAINAPIRRRFKEQCLPLPEVDPAHEQHDEIYQLWAFTHNREAGPIYETLGDFHVVPWFEEGFDILYSQKSKVDGIRVVLDHLNIPFEQAYAFGDGNNDKEMLAKIPNSIAMGDAPEAVRQVASYVTAPCGEDGIARALEAYGFLK